MLLRRNPNRLRTVSLTGISDLPAYRQLSYLREHDLDSLTELAMADTVRRSVDELTGGPLTSLVENSLAAPAEGPPYGLIPAAGVARLLVVTRFTDHGIDVHAFESDVTLIAVTRDGMLADESALDGEIVRSAWRRFVPYQGLGVTRATRSWLYPEALAKDYGLGRWGWPDGGIPVDSTLLASDEVRVKLNTPRMMRVA